MQNHPRHSVCKMTQSLSAAQLPEARRNGRYCNARDYSDSWLLNHRMSPAHTHALTIRHGQRRCSKVLGNHIARLPDLGLENCAWLCVRRCIWSGCQHVASANGLSVSTCHFRCRKSRMRHRKHDMLSRAGPDFKYIIRFSGSLQWVMIDNPTPSTKTNVRSAPGERVEHFLSESQEAPYASVYIASMIALPAAPRSEALVALIDSWDITRDPERYLGVVLHLRPGIGGVPCFNNCGAPLTGKRLSQRCVMKSSIPHMPSERSGHGLSLDSQDLRIPSSGLTEEAGDFNLAGKTSRRAHTIPVCHFT